MLGSLLLYFQLSAVIHKKKSVLRSISRVKTPQATTVEAKESSVIPQRADAMAAAPGQVHGKGIFPRAVNFQSELEMFPK